jgi:hypothetical protein
MCADPRSPIWRRRDTGRRSAQDAEVWVASTSPDGRPHLVWSVVTPTPSGSDATPTTCPVAH